MVSNFGTTCPLSIRAKVERAKKSPQISSWVNPLKTSKRVATKQALTLANKDNRIIVKDISTTGKTAEIVKFLQDNKIDRKVLIVVDEKTPELIRATNNLRQVRLVSALYLNVFDILNADTIVLNNKSVPVITDWLNKEVA